VDRLASIVERCGHDARDHVLMEIGRRFTLGLRGSDTVARLSDDQFAVVIEELKDVEHAAVVVQKVVGLVTAPIAWQEENLAIGASVGVVLYPTDGGDEESLLERAEAALSQARQSGDGYCFYAEAVQAKAAGCLLMGEGLRQALSRRELLVHYQPMVDLRRGTIAGREALLRWRYPGLGLVSPVDFLPIAEASGLMVDIGQWVLATVCGDHTPDEVANGIRIAVNLSSCQFFAPTLVSSIATLLKSTNIPPGLLELEIKEETIMADSRQAGLVLNELAILGVRLSVDDFGTGCSSLALLKRYPVTTLKIDISLVKELPASSDGGAIVAAIISMAHDLGLKVVAEGVERPEQLQFLRERNCDYVQGFFFGKPMPLAELRQLTTI